MAENALTTLTQGWRQINELRKIGDSLRKKMEKLYEEIKISNASNTKVKQDKSRTHAGS